MCCSLHALLLCAPSYSAAEIKQQMLDLIELAFVQASGREKALRAALAVTDSRPACCGAPGLLQFFRAHA